MKTDGKIPFIDVVTVAKELCEYVTGEEHDIIYIPVSLKENGEIKKYMSTVVCKKSEVEEAITKTIKMDGMNKEDYAVDSKYCHIATYPEDIKNRREIGFFEDDDCSIKADINEEYNYVTYFFRKFLNFRNTLISKRQTVKRDDIYQYFASVTGFGESKKSKKNKQKKLTK